MKPPMPRPERKGGKRWEGSPADRKADKAQAKKAGMSEAEWERSSEDREADDKAQRKLDRKRVRST